MLHLLRSRRWGRGLRRGLVAAIALDLLVAGAVVGLHTQDGADPLTPDAALERYRSGAGSASGDVAAEATGVGAPAGDTSTTVGGPDARASQNVTAADAAAPDAAVTSAPRPAAGVYTYDTTGFERLDALGGARHDYPSETTITVRHTDCGVIERWQPLTDRYDERSLCSVGDTQLLDWYESSRAFFGQHDTRRLRCDPGSVAFARSAPAGQVYRYRCTDPETDGRVEVTIVGDEDLTIGGVAVRARHLRSVSEVQGDSKARSTIDLWAHPDTGLVLRRTSTLDGTSPGPSGDVSYHEESTLLLRSLTPRT